MVNLSQAAGPGPAGQLMTPAEVATVFRVDAKTIGRLAEPSGTQPALFHPIRTPGGHRRYDTAEVERIARYLNGRPLTRRYTKRD